MTFMLATLALLISVQLTLGLAWLLSFFPPPQPLAATVFAEWQYLLKPEWEGLLYHFFIAAAVGAWIFLWRFWPGCFLGDQSPSQQRSFLTAEVVLSVALLGAGFMMVAPGGSGSLPHIIFVLLLILSLANKILWRPMPYRNEAVGPQEIKEISLMQPQENKNTLLVAISALAISLYLAVLIGIVVSFMPTEYHEEVKDFFLRHRTKFVREYDLFIYRSCIIAYFALTAAALTVFQKRLTEKTFTDALGRFAAVNFAWVMLEFFAAFKVVLYHAPVWATVFLYAAAAGHALSLVFWPEIDGMVKRLSAFLRALPLEQKKWYWWEIVVLVFVVWVPAAAVPHLEAMIQPYGLRIEPRFLIGMMTASALYFVLFYIFLRRYFQDVLLALAGVVLAIKWQLFHYGAMPLPWLFPYSTVINYGVDIIVFLVLLQYLQKHKPWWLILASIGVGGEFIWKPDTGLYLLLSFYVYVILLFFSTDFRREFTHMLAVKAAVVLPLLVAGIFYFLLHGQSLIPLERNIQAVPYYYCLHTRSFAAFINSYTIPIFYTWTLLIMGGKYFLKEQEGKDIFIPVLSVYGLLLFQHYLIQPSVTGYNAACVPLVIVMCFWLQRLLTHSCPAWKNHVLVLLLFVLMIALGTNRLFLVYPHLLFGAGS